MFPNAIVLGNEFITKGWAIIHSMGTLALINTFAIPVIRQIEIKKGRMLTPKEWMIKYFIINFVGVWGLARFSFELGMGISSWVVALFLAVILDVFQGIAMMQLEKMRKKQDKQI